MDKMDKLAREMTAGLDRVKAMLVPGARYRVTMLLRNEDDPKGHVLTGDDDLAGIRSALDELESDHRARRVSDGTEICLTCREPLDRGHCSNCDG